MTETIKITHDVVRVLEEKKAEQIVILDLKGIAVFTDYFVICNGSSERMLRSLVKTAKDFVNKEHGIKGKVEGIPSNGWIVVDFGNFVLHIFSPDQRNFYQLEDLWSDGKVLVRIP